MSDTKPSPDQVEAAKWLEKIIWNIRSGEYTLMRIGAIADFLAQREASLVAGKRALDEKVAELEREQDSYAKLAGRSDDYKKRAEAAEEKVAGLAAALAEKELKCPSGHPMKRYESGCSFCTEFAQVRARAQAEAWEEAAISKCNRCYLKSMPRKSDDGRFYVHELKNGKVKTCDSWNLWKRVDEYRQSAGEGR